MNNVKSKNRHSWISHNGKSMRHCAKCVTCGLIRTKDENNHQIYVLRGKTLDERPDCSKGKDEQWYN